MYWLPLLAKKKAIWSFPHSENQCQLSINNFGHCILGYLSCDWLQTSLYEVLTASSIKSNSSTLPAPSWKWVSMDPQRLLVLYILLSWHLMDIWDHNCTIDCLSTAKYWIQKAKRWFQNDQFCNLQCYQKGISGSQFTDFDQLQLSNSKSKSIIQIDRRTRGTTRRLPAQF